MSAEARVTDAIVLSENVDGDKKGGASFRMYVVWSRVLGGIKSEADGYPPQFFRLLAREMSGQKRDLRKSATSSAVRWSRGVSMTSGANVAKNGGSYHGVGGQRGLLYEVRLGEENILEANMRPRRSLKLY